MNNNFKGELKDVLKIAKWEFLLKTFTSVMIRGLLLIIPILLSEVINNVTKASYDDAVIISLIMMLVVGVYRFFEGYNQVVYYKLYRKLFNHYNNLALSKTKDNSLFSLSRFTPGQYANIVISDVDILSGFFSSGVIRIVQVVEFLVIYVYFFFLNFGIFVSAVFITICMLILSFRSCNKVQSLNEKRKQSLDSFTNSVYGYFGSVKEVKSYNIYENVFSLVDPKEKKYLDAHSKYNVQFNCINHGLLFVFEVFRLISVIYGIYLVKNGNLEVGTVLIIYNYYQKIIDNFSTILTMNVEYRNMKVSLGRFNKLVEYSKNKKSGLIVDKNEIDGKISFNSVLYGFRDNPTLNRASIDINPNSITVLTGKDEAGKNGIFDLLLRLNRQHEGSITIDEMNLDEIDDDSYYSMITSVRRNSVLFDVSIKDNFTMINPNFDRVVELCKELGLDEEISKLPKGYDTIIDNNTCIDQSTRELIVIARMLLKESKILLFDDLINVLDDKKEKKLLTILNDIKVDHTIVIISNSKDGVITSHTMHAMNMGVMGLVLSMINKYRRAPLYLTTNRNIGIFVNRRLELWSILQLF